MFCRLIPFLFAANLSVAGPPPGDPPGAPDDCPGKVADQAYSDLTEPFRLLATSVTHDGLFTVGVRADTLFSISDRTEAVGKLALPDAQFERISNGRNRWEHILRIAALNHSTSIQSRGGWVALTDSNGKAYVTRFPERTVLQTRLPTGDFAVGVGLSESSEKDAELAVFTNRGIYTAWLPDDIEARSTLTPVRTVSLVGLRNGISLRPGDHVVYDNRNTISRVNNGAVQTLGVLPGEIHSVSGYLYNRRLHLWVVTTGGKIYRWRAGELAAFETVPLRFPDGVSPSVVAAGAGLLHPDSRYRDEWTEGHFTRASATRYGLRIERLLFLTHDGAIFSPWPNARITGDRPGRLLNIELSPDFGSLAPQIRFETELLLKVRSIPVSPVELRMKRELLEEQGMSLKLRDLLISNWLQRVQRARYLEISESGIARFLDSIGVPRDMASRLVFLDALPSHFADLILKQRELVPSIVQKLSATNRTLLLNGGAFLEDHIENRSEARSVLLHIATLLGGAVYADEYKFLRELESRPESEQTIYSSLMKFIADHDPLWDPTWTRPPD